ncbi:TPA: hypothetical protein ACGSET_004860 [Escherichia coli]|uniref:hypothetical protein n=1 Tax=Escherichia coli TaxID=562 RepID=UPI00045376A3|nr:hypothetical protein [Escherichia coli]EYE08046.1 hypothetical protein AD08_5404 [Escherichia coli 1-110-08_S4_C2]EZJ32618.1 hypothetical protein AD38_5195 [Escherichia coli 1-176-05_S4_C3]MDA6408270.1 hypothetical protein [Escherichia coli]MDO2316235.1 hypothetical protein [Escherichia coli]HDX2996701.1 hypothetical protein [Escherichia coli]
MRLLIVIFLIFSVRLLAADEVLTNHLSPLPKINASGYEAQLKKFQELQRENFELKLKAQNEELKKKLGDNSIENVTVLSIYSSGKSGYAAKVYGGGAGLRVVKKGEDINDSMHVTEINQRKVTVFLSKENKILTLEPYTIGGG